MRIRQLQFKETQKTMVDRVGVLVLSKAVNETKISLKDITPKDFMTATRHTKKTFEREIRISTKRMHGISILQIRVELCTISSSKTI